MFGSAQRRVGRMSRLIRGAPLAVFALLALAAPAAAQSGSASPDLFGTVAFRVGTSAYEARWAPVLASRPDSAAWSRLLASGRAATSEAGKIAAVNQAVNASLEFGSDEALYGRSDRCAGHECLPGWQSVGRMARAAGEGWIEALADYAAKPGEAVGQAFGAAVPRRADAGLVLGWVLARV